MSVVLYVAAGVAAYLYLGALCWRIGHSGSHARTWSRPRPTRLVRSRGRHTKPPTPRTPKAEAAGLVVAA